MGLLRRVLIGLLLALVFATSASAGTHRHGSPGCTATLFRHVAKQVYQPWYQNKGDTARLRRLKSCSPNTRTLQGMRKIGNGLVRGRKAAVQDYRELTPYIGYGGRWAVPACIIGHESATAPGGPWKAVNPSSGAISPYQFLGHRFPYLHWPIKSFKDKMAMHRYAVWLWFFTSPDGQAWAGAWPC